MRHLFLLITLCYVTISQAQDITGSELLSKAIAFHDPNGNWKTFDGEFKVLMESPNSSNRLSTISLNTPQQKFSLLVEKDGDSYGYHFDKGICNAFLNGSNEISEEDIKSYRLTCDRGENMKNYYTYLYGLPMKLRDPGTLLDDSVQKKTFNGKEYLVLKVTYDKSVGNDIWYFYFDPKSYAMEVYQFYHDESKNDGEYILLEGLEEINGIKMPKTRAWYMNKDNKYLGTDILSRS